MVLNAHKGKKLNKIKTIDELENFLISPVEVLWKKQNGKSVNVLPVGGVVELSSLKKFPTTEINSFFDYEGCEKLSKLFENLKNAKQERERIDVASKILKFLEEGYWFGRNDVSLLTLVISCSQTFFDREDAFSNDLKLKSEMLYQRSLLLGTLNVIFLILIGHYSYKFLKEAFNVALYYEYEIVSSHLNTNSLEELEKARRGHYDSHFVSIIKADKKVDSMKWSFFSDMITKHYERVDATGADGLSGSEMSDTEKVLCSLHHALKIKSPNYYYDDGRGFLMGILANMKLDKKIELLISNNFKQDTARGA